MALSDTTVRRAKPGEKQRKLFDAHGLYLLLAPTGSRWWRLKYRFAGKEKLLALGSYPEVSLKEARVRCHDARKKLAAGVDPSADRKTTKAALAALGNGNFEAVAREWFEKFWPKLAPSHAITVIQRLEHNVFPWLGTRPIAEITAPEVLTVLRRIEARGALEVAHRVKQIIGQVFRYAVATGRTQRDPTGDLRGALPTRAERHHAALTKPADVAGLMRAIATYQGSFVTHCALRMSALTFARPGELRRAEWGEIDFDAGVWRIPAERMKMRRDHLVPLSRQAVEVLRALQPLTSSSRYLFPGARSAGRPMSENTICAALRYMGYERGQMTAHGFRTLASTLLNEMGWAADAIERQLAHAEHDEVRGAYNRAEYLTERRRMMQAWADYLDGFAATGAVIPLRAVS
jgi:integrase